VNISETCIRRPVMTTLITASLIVFGIFGYRLLAVAALPAVDFPTIEITATLPGASSETMGASVAGPIERQLSTISGITALTSTSALGFAKIVVQFDLNRNIDGAALDVQTALTVAARKLPIEMTVPPSFRKVNPSDQPIIHFSLVSSTLPLSVVDDYGEITLAQQISQLPGIAQVQVNGAQKFAVRVQVDPIAAASRGISLDDVRTMVAKTNSNTPVGTIAGVKQNTILTATAAMRSAAEYRDVIVAYRNGQPIKLREIARLNRETNAAPGRARAPPPAGCSAGRIFPLVCAESRRRAGGGARCARGGRLALDRNETVAQRNAGVFEQEGICNLFDDVTDLGAPSSPAPSAPPLCGCVPHEQGEAFWNSAT
jgi:hydrophobic/amphiphilic exporter-1 (mainly G- bacteria), HAE1 family